MVNPKILIVDDEPEILKSVSLRLKSKGYDVLTASDGFQATNTAMSENPSLVILDICMPAGDGHEVVKQLRVSERTRHIPIIFLTARTSEEDYRQAVECGVERYITKPFQPEKLMTAVEELLFSGQNK